MYNKHAMQGASVLLLYRISLAHSYAYWSREAFLPSCFLFFTKYLLSNFCVLGSMGGVRHIKNNKTLPLPYRCSQF